MKHSMNKWMAAVALLACAACSKNDFAIDNARLDEEKGVYGEIQPIIFDDPIDTRATINPANMMYQWETGDDINIWSDSGTLLIYSVVETSTDAQGISHASFDGGGYTLTDGATYYSSHPLIRSTKDKYKNLPTPYTGQVQTADGNADHIAEYMYTYASATCNNQKTSFNYRHLTSFMLIEATLPKAMTVTEVTVTANKQVFALNGTTDVTTGTFTPGTMSNTLTLTLDNVRVTDGVLNAFLATAPLEPATYILSVKDSEGTVYTSPEIVKKKSLDAGHGTYFRGTVSTNPQYQKVTEFDSDFAGQYILVYPVDGKYRAFSFIQTMENAEIAAESVANTSFLDLYDEASTLYNTVVGGNYVEITGDNAETLTLTPAQEAKVALTISANANPWANATDGTTTLSAKTAAGNTYSIPVDHLVASINSDGTADLVASFNAPGAVAAMNTLRGHDVNVTFDDLIKLALEKVDDFDATPNSIDDQFVRKAFTKLVAVAQEIVAENPLNLFPAGSSLMTIDFNTNAFDVFKQYHDNVADLSWRMSPEKRIGLAQLGYNTNANGFTAQVDLPSYEWFNKLNESLVQSTVPVSFMNGMATLDLPNREKFVNYWKAVDSQYTVNIDGNKIDNFFEKFATKLLAKLDEVPLPNPNDFMALMSYYRNKEYENDEFYQLYYAAAPQYGGEKFKKLGAAYKTLADKLNTGIQPAYIYKKVVE